MINLKLMTDLQGDTTASLLLKPSAPGLLQYFLISSSVNYNIVATGECEGELPSQSPRSFDVVLSTIAPLLNKNYQFRLSYAGGVLSFCEVNDRFSVVPLCVEHISDFAMDVAKRYMDFANDLSGYEENKESLDEAEVNLQQLRGNYQQSKILSLSGRPLSNPWGDASEVLQDNAIDRKYKPLIEQAEARVSALKSKSFGLRELDFEEFRRIATIASRNNATISMCDTYAVVDLTTAFILQKGECGSRSIQGKLLRRLLMEATGKFYEYKGDVVFTSYVGKGKDRSSTAVFINSYLPNVGIDSTIVTKGVVLEQYKLTLKGMLQVVGAVSSKFTTMVFDMGSSNLKLENDRGESLTYKFEVEDAKTIELNKAMRGEAAGDIVMSCVEIPPVVQRILPLLENDFVVHVKARKIILQSGTLYVVFGR